MREDLLKAPGARELATRACWSRAPPVRLLLANPEPNGSGWLLAGTVTRRRSWPRPTSSPPHRPALSGVR